MFDLNEMSMEIEAPVSPSMIGPKYVTGKATYEEGPLGLPLRISHITLTREQFAALVSEPVVAQKERCVAPEYRHAMDGRYPGVMAAE